MKIKIIKKNDKNILNLKKADNGVEYFSFDALEKYDEIIQGFSTRMGGVSEGPYAYMNLSFSREPDNKEGVLENYKRMAKALGVAKNSFVLSYQEHSTNVRVVDKSDMGKGVLYERDYRNIDGLITNERGITLGAFFADCIPLYFYDKEKKMGIDIFVKFPFSGSSYIIENYDEDKDIIKKIKKVKILSAYGNKYIVTKIEDGYIYSNYEDTPSKKEYYNFKIDFLNNIEEVK